MSFTFPRLQKITLNCFTCERFSSFIDGLRCLVQLEELNIRSLKGTVQETLLTNLLTANGRLHSVSFDQDSVFFNVSEVSQTVFYSNVQNLTVNITRNQALPHLFTLIPYIRRLHARIEECPYNSNLKQALNKLSPLVHLIDFHLYSTIGRWHFDEITGV